MRIRARKSLGQHFLRNTAILERIAAAAMVEKGDVVLEIGPGEGTLTAALLDRGAVVVGIEADGRLHQALLRRFADREFVLVPGDALELEWAPLVSPWTSLGRPWRIVGNIPYYITTPLLDLALAPPLPASVTFLVQREVAERVIAPPGGKIYGALSVGIQATAESSIPMQVPRGAFVPPPEVDSALLHLVPRQAPLIEQADIPRFRRLVTTLFSFRRKQMHRALREALRIPAERATALLVAAGIEPTIRPEGLAPEDFVRLLQAVKMAPGVAGEGGS